VTHLATTAAALAAAAVAALTPQQKAADLVVTAEGPGLFTGAAGITFADQEGGSVQAIKGVAPFVAAADYTSAAQALAAGRATRSALRSHGVDVDFGPVFDTSDGPLGSREFRSPLFAEAFARGLGDAACAKHFPGLGSAPISTDDRPHVDAHVRPQDLAPYRVAIRDGLGCVMVSNAFYGTRYRATLEPGTYRLLRSLGFRGIAITDSLSVIRASPVERWAPQAIRAGADMLLFTDPAQARRAVAALVPLARRGALDAHLARVLAFRRRVLDAHGSADR
jgi:beta-glucosidase-like glycosyl hydrolase